MCIVFKIRAWAEKGTRSEKKVKEEDKKKRGQKERMEKAKGEWSTLGTVQSVLLVFGFGRLFGLLVTGRTFTLASRT